MKHMNSKTTRKAALTCLVLPFLLSAALFTGCSKKSGKYETNSFIESDGAPAAQSLRMMKTSGYNDMVAEAYEMEPTAPSADTSGNASYNSQGSSTQGNLPADRKLIRTGNINMEVTSLTDTQTAAENWVKKFGGYISDSSENGRSLSLTAHIPSAHFDEAMSSSDQIGKITSKSVNSTDVTDQYYDLDTHLSTRRILLERLQTYLKQAKDMKDMLDIESKINDVTSEIEGMQGQLNRLTKQIDYSQIDIYAQLPVNHTEQGFVFPDTKSQFREFCGNILNFFSSFLFVLLYIIIYGVPIVLVLILLYWLCFGKVGLLRKLFAKVRAPRSEKKIAEKK